MSIQPSIVAGSMIHIAYVMSTTLECSYSTLSSAAPFSTITLATGTGPWVSLAYDSSTIYALY
jgi:hypothetical protein